MSEPRKIQTTPERERRHFHRCRLPVEYCVRCRLVIRLE